MRCWIAWCCTPPRPRSAAYLRGWLDVLKGKDHRRWIVQAANQATKATDFIMNRARTVKEVPEVDPTGV